MIVRRKTVTIDGAEITIAALTIDQVREAFTGDKTATRGEIVALSLNNARTNGQPEWNTVRAMAEMDSILFQKVYDEIVDFCGLKPEEPAPGEAPAPSAT